MSTPMLSPQLLELMEHEAAIERSLAELGWHLRAIRDGRLYRATHSTFEDYCQQRWSYGRNYVNKQIAAAVTIDAISAASTNVPTTEGQVRPLTSLPLEERAEAWTEAVERSESNQPTAAEVAEVVKKRRAPQPVPKPAPKTNADAPPHPAPFSDGVLDAFRELLEHHYCGETEGAVCDPFAGTGRIHELQRDGWLTLGVELEPEWADLHPDTICGDARALCELVYDAVQCEVVDVIATSPTYGNRLADSYDASDPEARRSYAIDLGRTLTDGNGGAMQWGAEYRQLHETVWRQCVDLLAPGGLFLLNCKDHQRDGKVVAVTGWHVRTLVELGLAVIDLRTLAAAGLPFASAKPLSELVVALRKDQP